MTLKKTLLTLIFGFIAVLLQGTLFGTFIPKTFIPNFALILVVFISFYENSVFGSFLAFLVGLEVDFFSSNVLGPWAGASVVVFGCFSMLSRRVFVESALTAMFAVFVSAVGANILYLMLLYRFKPQGSDIFSFQLLINSFVTALFGPLIFKWLRKVYIKRGHGLSSRMLAVYI